MPLPSISIAVLSCLSLSLFGFSASDQRITTPQQAKPVCDTYYDPPLACVASCSSKDSTIDFRGCTSRSAAEGYPNEAKFRSAASADGCQKLWDSGKHTDGRVLRDYGPKIYGIKSEKRTWGSCDK